MESNLIHSLFGEMRKRACESGAEVSTRSPYKIFTKIVVFTI